MSEEKGFLARWSRRKREGAAESAAPPDAASATAPPPAPSCEPPALPPLDSIGPGTDISAFLAPGVPTALSQAALRRAWSTDPGIRDFIGLSENSWDFTAVDGVPGFGAIDPEDVDRLLKRVIGEPEKAEPAASEAVVAAEPASEPAGIAAVPPAEAAPAPAESTVASVAAAARTDGAAAQHDLGEGDTGAAPVRRRHGGALPD